MCRWHHPATLQPVLILLPLLIRRHHTRPPRPESVFQGSSSHRRLHRRLGPTLRGLKSQSRDRHIRARVPKSVHHRSAPHQTQCQPYRSSTPSKTSIVFSTSTWRADNLRRPCTVRAVTSGISGSRTRRRGGHFSRTGSATARHLSSFISLRGARSRRLLCRRLPAGWVVSRRTVCLPALSHQQAGHQSKVKAAMKRRAQLPLARTYKSWMVCF